MLKAQFERFGKASEVVDLVECADPGAPGPGQIKLSLIASAINPSDLLTAEGVYGVVPPSLPSSLGKEALAKVIAVGEGVKNVRIGDSVYFNLTDKTWAEYFVLSANKVIAMPSGVDPLQLCMSIANPMSAYFMLKEYVNLQPGDWIIQNAANSGVGLNVIKLAKMWGLKTLNIVRRKELIAPLKAAGADCVLLDNDDIKQQFEREVPGAVVRLALDAVGGKSTNTLASCLSLGGTVVNYGLLSGENCEISAKLTVFNDIQLRGFWLQPRFISAGPAKIQEIIGFILNGISSGELSVPVHAVYPLAEIKTALAEAAKEGRNGKVILTGPAY